MLVGHTKFSPDGYFGLIKKRYRRSKVYTYDHLVDVINSSTTWGFNTCQRYRNFSAGGLGIGGESLSAFLHEIDLKKRVEITNKLKKAYPQLLNIDVDSLRSGWKKLYITEKFSGKRMSTEARHVSDGLLRMLAIFTQLIDEKSFVLLDEIENGINPELIELLIDTLVQSPHQVMITTHSPLILNYMDDYIAQHGVVYLYKSPEGFTRFILSGGR